MTTEEPLKLAVIGAGPQALAVLSRLFEPNPEGFAESPANGNLFSQSQGGNTFGKYVDNRRSKSDRQIRALMSAPRQQHELVRDKRIRVYDPFGEWMGKWEHQFQSLQIPVLRSHANLHSDPLDPECLQVFAAMHGRKKELWPMEAKRTDEYHGPFLLPSKPLFTDFQRSLVARYHLGDLVEKQKVVDIEVLPDTKYKLSFDYGDSVVAERLVISVGPTNEWQRNIPDWVHPEVEYPVTALRHTTDLFDNYPSQGFMNPERKAASVYSRGDDASNPDHSADHTDHAPRDPLAPIRDGHTLCIVGGGLTSAQLSIRAKDLGYSRVVLVSRSELYPKHFDLDMRWIGPYRNQMLGEYWSSPLEKRADMLKAARGGSSVTPPVLKQYRSMVSKGELELKEGVDIWDAVYCESEAKWTVDTSDEETNQFDTIWLATGSQIDIRKEPMFEKLLASLEVEVVRGFPAIAPSLELKEGSRVYLLGAYAAFALGPDALNLAGGMSGSSRIVPQLQADMGIELDPLPVHASVFTDATGTGGGTKGRGGRKKKK